MNVDIEPGRYVVAVSGGVDSMALLDLLRSRPDLALVVAHFDHGIRPDSSLDRQLVQEAARRHGLQFVYDEGHLGSDASEDTARAARYKFLRRVRDVSGARAIITAHHQDDLLETAIHNLLRGTGRRGLISLRSRHKLVRPLLHVPKQDLIAYAKDQGLVWREDSTNAKLQHRRNYIRHKILPKFSDKQKLELLQHIRSIHDIDKELDRELTNHLHMHPGQRVLDRHWFIMLPHSVAREVLAHWLRRQDIADINSKMLERLIVAAKTYAPGRIADIDGGHVIEVQRAALVLKPRGSHTNVPF